MAIAVFIYVSVVLSICFALSMVYAFEEIDLTDYMVAVGLVWPLSVTVFSVVCISMAVKYFYDKLRIFTSRTI